MGIELWGGGDIGERGSEGKTTITLLRFTRGSHPGANSGPVVLSASLGRRSHPGPNKVPVVLSASLGRALYPGHNGGNCAQYAEARRSYPRIHLVHACIAGIASSSQP